MKTPLYRRRWFIAGLGLIAIGLFTYFLSVNTQAKYEKQYPDLAMDERERFLEELNGDPVPALDGKAANRRSEAIMVHGLYGMYRYVGMVFIGLGILAGLLSFKEPQVPSLEDIEDDDSEERKGA